MIYGFGDAGQAANAEVRKKQWFSLPNRKFRKRLFRRRWRSCCKACKSPSGGHAATIVALCYGFNAKDSPAAFAAITIGAAGFHRAVKPTERDDGNWCWLPNFPKRLV